jgi:hypothetical protein
MAQHEAFPLEWLQLVPQFRVSFNPDLAIIYHVVKCFKLVLPIKSKQLVFYIVDRLENP